MTCFHITPSTSSDRRSGPRKGWRLSLGCTLAMMCLIGGWCIEPLQGQTSRRERSENTTDKAAATDTPVQTDAAVEAAQQQAQRLQQAIQSSPPVRESESAAGGQPNRVIAPPSVRWIEAPKSNLVKVGEAAPIPSASATTSTSQPGVGSTSPSVNVVTNSSNQVTHAARETVSVMEAGVNGSALNSVEAAPSTAAVATMKPGASAGEASVSQTREQWLEQWTQQLRRGEDTPMRRALLLALVHASAGVKPLDAAVLSQLDAHQQQVVLNFHALVATTLHELSDKGQVDANASQQRLADLLGEQPIRIINPQLCRKVQGFGVYEPFEHAVFLTGREQPLIVYVELEQFKAVQESDKWRVKLTQEIELYRKADGLLVWRQPAVQINDESRNRRRDFFMVQLIRLPATLGVGKYSLKVRVSDQNGGTTDEQVLPVEVVADGSALPR